MSGRYVCRRCGARSNRKERHNGLRAIECPGGENEWAHWTHVRGAGCPSCGRVFTPTANESETFPGSECDTASCVGSDGL